MSKVRQEKLYTYPKSALWTLNFYKLVSNSREIGAFEMDQTEVERKALLILNSQRRIIYLQYIGTRCVQLNYYFTKFIWTILKY